MDPEGQLASYLQLKASDSVSYIHEALSRCPDIPILSTGEVSLGILVTITWCWIPALPKINCVKQYS